MRKTLLIVVTVLVITGALGALRYALRSKGRGLAPPPSRQAMAERFHQGARPCLRYVPDDEVSEDEVAEVTATFTRLELTSRNATDEADELTEAISDGASLLARVVVWSKKDQFRRAFTSGDAQHFAQGAWTLGKLTQQQQDGVRALWEAHPEALTLANLVKVIQRLRVDETNAGLEVVAQAITYRAPADERDPERIARLTELSAKRLRDAWGTPFTYDTTDSRGIRVISVGADGLAGGTGEDADLTSFAVQRPAPGTAASPEWPARERRALQDPLKRGDLTRAPQP